MDYKIELNEYRKWVLKKGNGMGEFYPFGRKYRNSRDIANAVENLGVLEGNNLIYTSSRLKEEIMPHLKNRGFKEETLEEKIITEETSQ